MEITAKVFKVEGKYVDRNAQISIGTYASGALAVQLIAPLEKDVKMSEVIATVSVNTDQSSVLPSGQFFVKNYSENEGIIESLESLGVIECVDKEGMQSGFVNLPIYKLNEKQLKR